MEAYQRAAGQHFNLRKSNVLFGNSRESFKARTMRSLGIPQAFLPAKYLGVPLFIGSPKAQYFESLKDTFRHRLAGWKCSMLSFAGRVILIKHVLQSLPIHILLVLPIPFLVCKFLENWMRNFLWSGGPEQAKKSLLIWNSICQPKSEGGLGFRRIKDMVSANSVRLGCSAISSSSLWASWFRAEYLKGFSPWHPSSLSSGSCIWRPIKR